MNTKKIYMGSLLYLQTIAIIITVCVTFDKEYFFLHMKSFISIISVATLLIPILVMLVFKSKTYLATKLRGYWFKFFGIDTFSIIGLFVPSLFIFLIIYNFLTKGFNDDQIFLNLLSVNLLVLYMVAFLINGHFKILSPQPFLVRREGEIVVYLHQNGKIRGIPDPETFKLLGFSYYEVKYLNERDFSKYEMHPPLPSIHQTRLIQVKGKKDIWVVFENSVKLVPNNETLEFIRKFNNSSIEDVPDFEFESYKKSNPLRIIQELR